MVPSKAIGMESVQHLILNTLDTETTIQDTRTLILPGETAAAVSQDAQLSILGALNSLSSREVSGNSCMSSQVLEQVHSLTR